MARNGGVGEMARNKGVWLVLEGEGSCGLVWLDVGCGGKMKKMLRHRTRALNLHVMPKARIVVSCVRHWFAKRNSENYGSLAQLVERHVYTVDVIGSIPVGPTDYPGTARYRGFCLPGYVYPLTCREGTRREAHEDNLAGTAIPSSIKLHSTYI